MKKLIYTGIGSRTTPENVLKEMNEFGKKLANRWILRTGHAEGADMAFEIGCATHHGHAEIYLPWKGFNNAPVNDAFIVPNGGIEAKAREIAASYHPNWSACSEGAKKLHTRNAYQILGENLDQPSHLVICYTPNGVLTGGTSLALRIAYDFDIPVFNLAHEVSYFDLDLYTALLEEQFYGS